MPSGASAARARRAAPTRVAEIVQRVEERDDVVGAGVRDRVRDLERDPVLHPGLGGPPPRRLDRLGVDVEAGERRVRERLGHHDRRRSVPASDVGDGRAALELLDEAVDRREPVAEQMHPVQRAERALRAVEEIVVMLVPSEPVAGQEPLGDLLAALDHRGHGAVDPRHRDGARLVGEHERVLGREHVGVVGGVVGDEAAGRLRVEPLAHVALVGRGARGELGRGHGLGVGHRPVEPEPVADVDERGVDRRARLDGDESGERLDPALVQGLHGASSGWWRSQGRSGPRAFVSGLR